MSEAQPQQRVLYHRYSVNQILAERKRLFEILEHEFFSVTVHRVDLSGPIFVHLVTTLWKILPPGASIATLHASLLHLAGHNLDRADLRDLCWRLAGNRPRLRRDIAVPPWTTAHQPEWMPMIVLSCKRSLNRRQKPGALFGCQVAAGAACTLMVYKWLSLPLCRMMARQCGYRDRHRDPVKRSYHDPEQLVLMRWCGLISADTCVNATMGFDLPIVTDAQTGMAAFHRHVFSASLTDWNEAQVKRRSRVDDGYTCPDGHSAQYVCQFCPRGYTTCKAATHRQAWLVGTCAVCGKLAAWLDPELSATVCVDCVHKAAYQKGAEHA